jgi:hypothetical protein
VGGGDLARSCAKTGETSATAQITIKREVPGISLTSSSIKPQNRSQACWILHQPRESTAARLADAHGGILQVVTQIAGALLGLVLFAAAFIFTSLVFAIAAAGALILWGWVMWRTRHARRAANEAARDRGAVIEGEYVVDRDEQGPTDRVPGDPCT